jgi:hypothetical protein
MKAKTDFSNLKPGDRIRVLAPNGKLYKATIAEGGRLACINCINSSILINKYSNRYTIATKRKLKVNYDALFSCSYCIELGALYYVKFSCRAKRAIKRFIERHTHE